MLKELSSSFVVNMSTGVHAVSLQWKKIGTQISKWVIAPVSAGSGYTLAALANHDVIWHLNDVSDMIISAENVWKPLSNKLKFELDINSNVTIGYSVSIQPQVGKFIKDLGLEMIEVRIVLDDIPYYLGTTTYGTSTWNPLTGNIYSYISLNLPSGNHQIYLQWRKMGTAFTNWMSAPSLYDGFASSRNLFVMLEKSEVVQYVGHTRSILSSDGEWKTVGDSQITFTLNRETSLLIEYALPITQLSNPNFDSYSWDQLVTVSSRLLIDNIPYTYAGKSVGAMSKTVINLYGNLAIIMPVGSHTISLQWRVDQDVNWLVLNEFSDGFLGSERLLIFETSSNSMPSLVAPSNISTDENIAMRVRGVYVNDSDSLYVENFKLDIKISVNTGTISFDISPTDLSHGNLHIPTNYVSFYDTIDAVNAVLSTMTYYPKPFWYGSDIISASVSDLGVLGYGGAYNVSNRISVFVYDVDYPFTLNSPTSIYVGYSIHAMALVNVTMNDIDSENATFRLSLRSKCGGFVIANTGVIDGSINIISNESNSLVFEAIYSDMVDSLSYLSYRLQSLCSKSDTFDLISLNMINLNSSQSQLITIPVIVHEPKPIMTFTSPKIPSWLIQDFLISGVRDNDPAIQYDFNSSSRFSLASGILQGSDQVSTISNIDYDFQYAFEISFGSSYRIDYVQSPYLTINQQAIVWLSVVSVPNNITSNIFCRIKSDVFPGHLFPKNKTVMCAVDTTLYIKDSEKISTVFINIIVQNEYGQEILSTRFLPFYPVDQPTISRHDPTCLVQGSSGDIVLVVHNSAVVDRCHIDGQLFPAVVSDSSSTVYCNYRNLQLSSNNIKVSVSSADDRFISNQVEIALIPQPKLISTEIVRINSSDYLSASFDSLDECLFRDDFAFPVCIYSNSSVQATHQDNAIICAVPFAVSESIYVTIRFESFSFDINIDAPIVMADVSNIVISSAIKLQNDSIYITYDANQYMALQCISSSRYLASIVSSSALICPPMNDSFIYLSDDKNNTSNIVNITKVPFIFSSNKSYACMDSGCDVVIQGIGFISEESIVCQYNEDIRVNATFISSSSIQCAIPPTECDSITVRIYQNGLIGLAAGMLSAGVIDIRIIPTPTLTRIYPRAFIEANRSLYISGDNFSAACELHYSVSCNGVDYLTTYVNDTTLSISFLSENIDNYALRVKCVNPSHGRYLNGVLSFQIVRPIRISSVVPSFIDPSNGADIAIDGDNFFTASSIRCLLGDTKGSIVGNYQNSTIFCHIPSMNINQSMDVSLSLDLDDVIVVSPISLTFKIFPIIEWFSPTHGMMSRTTNVSIYGSKFSNSGDINCLLNSSVRVAAKVVAEDHIICPIPKSDKVGSVNLEILYDDTIIASKEPLIFRYDPSPVLFAISPISRIQNISTKVNIYSSGLNMYPDAYLDCLFGDVIVSGAIVSDSEGYCILPLIPLSEEVNVTISLNGVSLDGSFIFYSVQYIDIYQVHNADTISAGNDVLITGAFYRTLNASCIFESIDRVPAIIVNSSYLKCIAPSLSDESKSITTKLFVQLDGLLSRSFIDITYKKTPVISSIHSCIDNTLGGTDIISIYGKYFSDVPSICVFGDFSTIASYRSDTTFRCSTPSHNNGSIPLSFFQNNRRILTEDGQETLEFSFVASPIIMMIKPTIGSTHGEEQVYVTIDGDIPSSNHSLFCQFGLSQSQRTPATLFNDSTLSCMTPVQSNSGIVEFVIVSTESGQRFLGNYHFTFIDEILITSIDPKTVSASYPANIVLVGGIYPLYENLRCVYSIGMSSEAIVISENMVQCLTPSLNTTENVVISVRLSIENRLNSNEIELLLVYPSRSESIAFSLHRESYQTIVIIYGSGYLRESLTSCLINNIEIFATYISPNEISCRLPYQSSSTFYVRLLQDGIYSMFANNSVAEFTVEISGTPQILSIYPKIFDQSNDSVHDTAVISGINFEDDANLTCLFDMIEVKAIYLNASSILCPIPSQLMFRMSQVSVLSSFRAWSGVVYIRFIKDMDMTSIYPSSGKLSGDSISVYGTFFATEDVKCQYGSLGYTQGQVINSSLIICPSLVTSHPIEVNVSIILDGLISKSSVLFSFVNVVSIYDILPSIGPTYGRSAVTILGSGFDNSSKIFCDFDNELRLAFNISHNSLMCIPPSHPVGLAHVKVIQNDIVSTASENNGLDYLKYQYTDGPWVNNASPLHACDQSGYLSWHGFGFLSSNFGPYYCDYSSGDVHMADVINDETLRCFRPAFEANKTASISYRYQDSSVIISDAFLLESHPAWTLTHLFPTVGKINARNIVYIFGHSLWRSETSECVFEGIGTSPAIVLNDTVIKCVTPLFYTALETTISIRSISSNCHSSSLRYQVIPQLSIDGITPDFGDVSGGTIVSVTGHYFSSNVDIYCAFGDKYTIAIFKSFNQILCRSPANIAGVAMFSVYQETIPNDESLTISFTYQSLSFISSMTPTVVLANVSTAFQIQGNHFTHYLSKDFSCLVGDTEGMVQILNDTAIECTIWTKDTGSHELRLHVNDMTLGIINYDAVSANDAYYLISKEVMFGQEVLVEILFSHILPHRRYYCHYDNSSVLGYILQDRIYCKVILQQSGSNAMALSIENDYKVFEFSIMSIVSPSIVRAEWIVLSRRLALSFQVANASSDIDWYCILGTDQMKAIQVMDNSNYICLVRNRYHNYSTVMLQDSSGYIVSNIWTMNISTNQFAHMINMASTAIDSSKGSDWINRTYSFTRQALTSTRLVDSSEMLQSYQEESFLTQNQKLYANLLPFKGTIKDDIFRQYTAVSDDKGVRTCLINGVYSCLTAREQVISGFQDIEVHSQTIRNNSDSDIQPSPITTYLYIEDIQPNVIASRNGSWVSVFGHYFDNSTQCIIRYPDTKYLRSIVLTSSMMQCFIPSQYELRSDSHFVSVYIRNYRYNVSSENSFILFFQLSNTIKPSTNDKVEDAVNSNPFRPGGSFDRLISQNILPQSSYFCDNMRSIMGYSSYKYQPRDNFILKNFFQQDELGYLSCLSHLSMTSASYSQLSSSHNDRAINHTSTPDKSDIQRPSVKLLSDVINIGNGNTSAYVVLNISNQYYQTVCLRMDLSNIIEQCYQNNSIFKCFIPVDVLKTGSVSISILGECQNLNVLASYQMEISSMSSGTIFNEEQIVASISPSVTFTDGEFRVLVTGYTMNRAVESCRFVWYDADYYISHEYIMIATIANNIVICHVSYVPYEGLAEVYLGFEGLSAWISTYATVRVVPQPTLFYASYSHLFNDTIMVYGDLFHGNLPYICDVSLRNGHSFHFVGIIVNSQQINCIGYRYSNYVSEIDSLRISCNGIDYFPVQYVSSPHSHSSIKSEAIIDRKISDAEASISFNASDIFYETVCHGQTMLRWITIDDNLYKEYYGLMSKDGIILHRVFQSSFSTGDILFPVPSMAPGVYTLGIYDNKDELQQNVTLTCVYIPRMIKATLLPVSSIDGSSSFRMEFFMIDIMEHINIQCQYGLLTVDSFIVLSSSEVYCIFSDLVTGIKNKFTVSIGEEMIFDTEICLNEHHLLHGMTDLTNITACDSLFEHISPSISISNHILSVSPQIGASSLPKLVLINITNISLGSKYSCVFGDIVVSASIISLNQIGCLSPVALPGNRSLHVIDSRNNRWCCSWYAQYPLLKIIDHKPSFVVSVGGDIIRLNLSYLPTSSALSLYCLFGLHDKVAASRIIHSISSESTLMPDAFCVSPQTNEASLNVSFGIEDEIWTSSISIPVLNIDAVSVFPRYGSRMGGTNVTITFPTALLMTEPTCSFGNVSAVKSFFNYQTNQLTCESPPHENGYARLLTFDRGDLFAPTINISTYIFGSQASINSCFPKYLRYNESTELLVTGTEFEDREYLSCHINDRIIRARWLSSNEILCSYYIPETTLNRIVSLRVSNNGQDISKESITLEVIGSRSNVVVSPFQGYSTSNTPLTIRVLHYQVIGQVYCNFGSIVTPSFEIEDTNYICHSPSNLEGSVRLDIRDDNGEIWTGNYTYIAYPIIVGMSSTAIIRNISFNHYIYGTNFIEGTIGYINGIPSCRFTNISMMTCQTFADSDNLARLDLSVNGGVDFLQDVYIFQVISPPTILSVRPTSILLDREVSIEIAFSQYHPYEASPIYCRYSRDGAITLIDTVYVSDGYLQCSPPNFALNSNITLSLSLTQLNHIIYPPVSLSFHSTPIVISIDPIVIFSGKISNIILQFKESIHSLSMYCEVDDGRYDILMIDDVTGNCVVQSNRAGEVVFYVKVVEYRNSTVVFNKTLTIIQEPNDLLSNVTALVAYTPSTIRLQSASCLIPSIPLFCESTKARMETIYHNNCEIVCRMEDISIDYKSIDIGICYQNPSCLNFQYVLSLDVLPLSVILSIDPPSGPVQGNTSINIYGIGLQSNLVCNLGNIFQVPLHVISTVRGICITPPHIPSTLSIRLYKDNVDVSGSSTVIYYQYLPLVKELTVSTTRISSLGSTRITVITNEDVMNSVTYDCKFDDVISPAVYLDFDRLECLSPEILAKESVSFILQKNHEDFSDPIILSVLTPPFIALIYPDYIVSKHSSGSFTIVFDGIVPYSNQDLFLCQLDEMVMESSFNDDTMTCSIDDFEVREKSSHNLRIFFADSLIQTFSIEVISSMIVQSVHPSVGFFSSSGSITINHLNDVTSSRVTKCCFIDSNGNSVYTPLTVLSSYQSLCHVPTISFRNEDLEVMNIGFLSQTGSCNMIGFAHTYVNIPSVSNVSSLSGYIVGGDHVVLTFSKAISQRYPLYCRIGMESFLAKLLDDTSLLCITKPSEISTNDIEISINNIEFISTGYSYTYLPLSAVDRAPLIGLDPPIIDRISPTSFAAGQYQTVKVFGSNFLSGALCAIGSMESVEAYVISSMELRCKLPPHPLGFDTLRIINPRGNSSYSFAIEYVLAAFIYTTPGNSVSPSFVPLNSSTLITVYGNNLNLITSPPLYCLIGEYWSVAIEISIDFVRCLTPPSPYSGRVSVLVANSNRDFIPGYGSFEYIENPIIYDFKPDVGYVGSQIIVNGRGFSSMPQLYCLFDDIQGNTTILSDSDVLCEVPDSLSENNYTIGFATNGQNIISSGKTFQFISSTKIYSLWPSHGPAMKGNSIVSLYGVNFPRSVDMYCIFGSSRVLAYLISSTEIKCRAPSHIPGIVNVTLFAEGVVIKNASSSLQFAFVPDVSVDKIFPRDGFVGGDKLILVFGSNFLNTTSLGCSFADMKSRGIFISSTVVGCMSPSPIGRSLLKNNDYIPVEITTNGYDYSNSNVSFRYTNPCSEGSFCVGSSSYLCPNGTYCEANSRNFTLCPPGYFQPKQGND